MFRLHPSFIKVRETAFPVYGPKESFCGPKYGNYSRTFGAASIFQVMIIPEGMDVGSQQIPYRFEVLSILAPASNRPSVNGL